MAKILITGGAGFIGSNLTKKLVEQGHEVIIYDNLLRGNKLDHKIKNSVELIVDDVRNRDAVFKASSGCDYIFHFAAVLGVDVVADNPVETMEVEVLGAQNIAHAAIKNGIKKVLYASTSGIYGHSAMEHAVTENIIVDPRTSYAMAKRYNEIYYAALYEEKGLNTLSLRFFNVYGHNQDNRMVVPRFFEQALKNEPITVFGNGKQTRDFTYIDDCVKACILLMEKIDGNEIFNIANETEFPIGNLAVLIKKITGSSSEIKYIDAPKKRYDYEVERRVGSSDKLREYIAFKPSTALEIGLEKIYEINYKK
jgi:UDP-glucose 4-epimerase